MSGTEYGLWPTTTKTQAPDQPGLHSFNGQYWMKPDGRKHQTDLTLCVMGREKLQETSTVYTLKLLPTPQRQDNRDRGCLKSPSVMRRAIIGKQLMLSQVVSEQHGKLNPTWVEWLMGYPINHTDLDA